MSLDATRQREILEAVARAAREEGCLAAPVGSVYFLLAGLPRVTTKDVDAVIHSASLEPPPLDVLKRIAERLQTFGSAATTTDGAVVQIRSSPQVPAEIELIRGRTDAKGGFFPRALLVAAAKAARRDGNLLLYPLEHVLVLKADAAVDREDRALRDPARAREHRRRADAFRADVLEGVNSALLGNGISAKTLGAAIAALKKSRQERVRSLFRSAGIDL